MDVKVVLTLIVPGAVMVQQELAKTAQEENEDIILVPVQGKDKKGNLMKKETLVVRVRKTKDAVRKIKMSREAYEYMLSTPVDPKMAARWKSARNNDRLRYHFEQIANDFGAKSYSFEVLED